MPEKIVEITRSAFAENFGDTGEIVTVAVPASLIVLGDHTHYNDGLIISAAVNRYVVASVSKRDDEIINIVFSDCDLSYSLSFDNFPDKDIQCGQVSFGPLLKILDEENILSSGFNCLINSNVPSAIGLGGVTAHHVAFLSALNQVFDLDFTREELISLSRQGELESIGKISNIAHHNTVLYGQNNSLNFFDIRKNESKNLDLSDKKYKVLICDTDKIISNIKDICNERISECSVGVEGLRLYIWGIKNLRDINLDFLEKHIHMIPKRIYSRVLYNVSERLRVEDAIKTMQNGNFGDFKDITEDSHKSLRNDYEIGSETLDYLTSFAKQLEGVYSSKMISCSPIESTYNIVEADKAEQIAESIKEAYHKKFGSELITYTLNLVDGYNMKQVVNLS